MISFISKIILRLLGWKILGQYPHDVAKKLIIGAPHTSNWDFPLGLLVRSSLKADIKFIGKASLFKPPLSWIMYPLGGIPVIEEKGVSFVESVVKLYNQSDRLTVAMSPEGQRKMIHRFKTGFYYIAKLANIPILPLVLDWDKKEIRLLELVQPGDDPDLEIKHFESLFKGVIGLRKDQSFF